MKLLIPLAAISAGDHARCGGKAVSLARLEAAGFTVPPSLCLTTAAYEAFVADNGLREFIHQELGRKDLGAMRWEEIWDAALRIRNRFLRGRMPDEVRHEIERGLADRWSSSPLVVRSSAPGEDSASTSFAGLHESVVGVGGLDEALEAVRRVWASLWSDRALLYRQELGLQIDSSAMAVLLQELIEGDCSGVAFGVHPSEPGLAAVEAVYGLNQGLVDGSVEPDHWDLDRESRRPVSHTPPPARRRMISSNGTTKVQDVPLPHRDEPPLAGEELQRVVASVLDIEQLFGAPQDVEWTWVDSGLVILQARPVTTSPQHDDDRRAWYLSLTRSLDTLQRLRSKVENELLPGLDLEADELAKVDIDSLDDRSLAREIERRHTAHDRWVDVYWQEFIPLAHGIRLFGRFYNDVVRPADPYQFMELLTSTAMLSTSRNRELAALAAEVAEDPGLRARLEEGQPGPRAFESGLADFQHRHGGSAYSDRLCFEDRSQLVRLVLRYADAPTAIASTAEHHRREDELFAALPPERMDLAKDLLELGRVSYRLRDDDNIHLARLKGLVLAAVGEGRRRLESRHDGGMAGLELSEVVRALRDPNRVPEPSRQEDSVETEPGFRARPRQLVGQPAGPGVAVGRVHLVRHVDDLFTLERGDVLVCDAVDPNMTFVVPLAAAIVERRGGMLIHGAIIAREYGIPCVTGVPGAVDILADGDLVTVDGHLGIVTVTGSADAR